MRVKAVLAALLLVFLYFSFLHFFCMHSDFTLFLYFFAAFYLFSSSALFRTFIFLRLLQGGETH